MPRIPTRIPIRIPIIAGTAFALVTGMGAADAPAQSVADFYKDKTVTINVGFNPGGGYDTYARLVANHLGKHIPGNPNLIVKNMPGAGSLKAANYLGNKAARDGSEMGMISGAIAVDPVIGGTPTKFDSRDFYWLGSANVETGACFARTEAPQDTIQDVMANEIITGAARGTTFTYPTAMNQILGTKFKLITGYKGSKGLLLAIEKKEVDAICGNIYTTVVTKRPHWLKENTVKILVQVALEKHPDMPDVPLIMDLPKSDEDRQALRLLVGSQTILGRPFLLPPEVPGDRARAARKAFGDAMADKELVAQANKMRLELRPSSGAEVEAFVKDVYRTPKPVVENVAEALQR